MGAIVPRAVDALDPDELLERLDLDAVLARVDLNLLLDRLDLDAVLARLDLDQLMAKIDVGALIARVDVNALMNDVDVDALITRVDLDRLMQSVDIDGVVSRVDLDRLMQSVDVDALVGRIDVNALVDDVDVAALVARAGIDQIVSDATSGIATRTLDMARRQLLGIDMVMLRLVDRTLRRPAASQLVAGDQRPAGPLSRVLGFLIDSVTVSATFGLGVSLIGYLVGLFSGEALDQSSGDFAFAWLGAYLAWWFTYLWTTIAIAGRTLGKGLVGLKVVAVDGSTLRPGAAARRAVAFPVSLILGLGFIPAIVGKERRAAHDYFAGSREIVDWGPRPVTPPPRLLAWHAPSSAPEPTDPTRDVDIAA